MAIGEQPSPDAKLVETWINLAGQYNDRLLATVYWSLGVVGFVFAGLIGFGWFVNYRVYERDKSAMALELHSALERRITELSQSLAQQHAAQVKALQELTTKTTNELLAPTKLRLASVQKNLNEEVTSLQLASLEQEAILWEMRGTLANAIRCEVKRCSIAMERGSDWLLQYVLPRVEELLGRSKAPGGSLEADLNEMLNKLPNQYSSMVTRIRRKLADAPK